MPTSLLTVDDLFNYLKRTGNFLSFDTEKGLWQIFKLELSYNLILVEEDSKLENLAKRLMPVELPKPLTFLTQTL